MRVGPPCQPPARPRLRIAGPSPVACVVLTTVVIMANDDLPAIDPNQLEAVTGGVTHGGSDANAQVTAMLQQLMQSISELAHHNNSGTNQFMQMLPILMMMRGRQGPAPSPAAPAPPPGGGGGRGS